MLLLFKGTNQKVHILLLRTHHSPELTHVATTSYQENLEYSFGWAAIYPVKKFYYCVRRGKYIEEQLAASVTLFKKLSISLKLRYITILCTMKKEKKQPNKL